MTINAKRPVIGVQSDAIQRARQGDWMRAIGTSTLTNRLIYAAFCSVNDEILPSCDHVAALGLQKLTRSGKSKQFK
ncbi:hypothetical protein [Cognatiyoonia sp. IB215182]|uniref:hypothetical protein n=1 Tax=Cognatiyoonia sp. IB215182 TaxID=3097353 RepID=UPI002A10F0D5|nr:hypothetical protein [Cognatiyoonia sp. IB215182]MDX8353619.1 hypothetical protein [Cognatiyoonia sp. IB215182]